MRLLSHILAIMSHLVDRLKVFIDEHLAPMATMQDKKTLPSNIADVPLRSWDKAVFSSELVKLNIVPPVNPVKVGESEALMSSVGDGSVQEGTYSGTQLALTEMYDRIERG